ncbi:MAG: SRPBCC family protein [Acidobacteriaceae bacterium]|nr:SRPBCC family protein [Acidobacteriaceae bacterium]
MASQIPQQRENRQGNSQGSNEERIANGLGWFSIALGLAEVAAPGQLADLIGVRKKKETLALLRIYGLREIAAGIGILAQPRPTGWLWARVAGDLLDLSALGSALASNRTDKARAATATAAVIGVTAVDVLCARQMSQSSGDGAASTGAPVYVTKTIIVGRSADEIYRFWRDFTNLPAFMKHLQSVEITAEKQSHWKAEGPAGTTIEWDAEIVDDQPGVRIGWQSLEGADVDNSGAVYFERATGGRGTLVRVELQYAPPGGAIGASIAKLFGKEPGQEIEDDLRALKQVMETGEVAKSDASIHSGLHPAQPAEAATA